LFKTLGFPVPASYHEAAQCARLHFMRKPGVERWQVHDGYAERKTELRPLLQALGFVDTIAPVQKHFRYGVIFGATYKTLAKRFSHMMMLWQQGIRFDQLIFLVGQRPLQTFEQEQILAAYNCTCAMETDIAKLLYERGSLPDDLKKIPVLFVDAPGYRASDGSWQRPTTGSTISSWLASHPAPGSIVAISNQPYVCYQDAVLHAILPATFDITTVGLQARSDESITTMLDSLARYLCLRDSNIENQAILFNP
jgi:hypothetical protein